jgi:hypothetical protein
MTVAYTAGKDRGTNLLQGRNGRAGDELVPGCDACGTDEYLVFEDYEPPQQLPTGHIQPGSASYWCTKCDQFSGHDVPLNWVPPRWRITLA